MTVSITGIAPATVFAGRTASLVVGVTLQNFGGATPYSGTASYTCTIASPNNLSVQTIASGQVGVVTTYPAGSTTSSAPLVAGAGSFTVVAPVTLPAIAGTWTVTVSVTATTSSNTTITEVGTGSFVVQTSAVTPLVIGTVSLSPPGPYYDPAQRAIVVSGTISSATPLTQAPQVAVELHRGPAVLAQAQAPQVVLTGGMATFQATLPFPAQGGNAEVVVTATDTAVGQDNVPRFPATRSIPILIGAPSMNTLTLVPVADSVPRGADGGAAIASVPGGAGTASLATTTLPSGNPRYTLALWCRVGNFVAGSVTALAVGDVGTANAGVGIVLTLAGQTFTVGHSWGPGNVLSGAAPMFSDGRWHLVTATWDGTTRAIAVDGVVVAQDTPGSSLNLASSPPVTINLNALGLAVARPRIWTRALSLAEQRGLMDEVVPADAYLRYEWLFAELPLTTTATDTAKNSINIPGNSVLTLTNVQVVPDQPRTIRLRPRGALALTGAAPGGASGPLTYTSPISAATLACWVKPTAFSQATILSWGNGVTLRLASQAGDGQNGVAAVVGGTTLVAPVATLLDGHWHHVAVTAGYNGIVIYVDGVAVATNPSAPTVTVATTATVTLAPPPYAGRVHGAGIWNTALAATDVALVARGARCWGLLVAYWPCNDRGATTLADLLGATPLTVQGGQIVDDAPFFQLAPFALFANAPYSVAGTPFQIVVPASGRRLPYTAAPGDARQLALTGLDGIQPGQLTLQAATLVGQQSAITNPLTLRLGAGWSATTTLTAAIRTLRLATVALSARLAANRATTVALSAALSARRTAAVTLVARLLPPAPPVAAVQAQATLLAPPSPQDQATAAAFMTRIVGRVVRPDGTPVAGLVLTVALDVPPRTALRTIVGPSVPYTVVLGGPTTVTTAADGSFSVVVPAATAFALDGLRYRIRGQGVRVTAPAPVYPATVAGGPIGPWQPVPLRAIGGVASDASGAPLANAVVNVRLALPRGGLVLVDGTIVQDAPLEVVTDAGGAWSCQIVSATVGNEAVRATVRCLRQTMTV